MSDPAAAPAPTYRFVATWSITDLTMSPAALFAEAADNLPGVARRTGAVIVGRPKFAIRPAADIAGPRGVTEHVVTATAMASKAIRPPDVAERGHAKPRIVSAATEAARAAATAAHTDPRATMPPAGAPDPTGVRAAELAAITTTLPAALTAPMTPTAVDLDAVDLTPDAPATQPETPLDGDDLADAVARLTAEHPNATPTPKRTSIRPSRAPHMTDTDAEITARRRAAIDDAYVTDHGRKRGYRGVLVPA